MSERISVEDYYAALEPEMGSLNNIFTMVFRKQARDMGLSGQVSPKEMDELISRTGSAIEFFVGADMRKKIERKMRSQLKKMAPEYFMKKYGL